ncbi:uncharacterized protein LOC117294428 [Asterias rubens]|uniref:uncharacterized protein LOC117294428 n=1 Tax=Asterias rubens TaxID=7604 RepID=UPI00145549D1|nr:uncharacterized protein LOC117294428 [Asterias rubens]
MFSFLLLCVALAAPALCATTTSQPDKDNMTAGNVFNTGNTTAETTTPRAAPSVCSLSLYISDENNPIQQFNKLVEDDGAIFIYMKLDFVDEDFGGTFSAYLDAIGNIIDPLTWVWAKGGRGKLLLASPFDFNHLSLTTLGQGVHSLNIKVEGSDGCFAGTNRTDGEKLLMIAVFLQDVIKTRHEDNGDADSDEGTVDDELICLEKQLGKKDITLAGLFNLPGGSYSTMQLSTAYDCWSNGEANKSKRVYKESWLNWILAGGIVLAMFSPIAMSFFIQKNPPETDEHGLERISLVSDLPLGLKYVTCFWAKNNKCVSTTRWTLFLLLFIVIQYIPVLISFLTDTDGFIKRSFALYNTGPQNGLLSVIWHLLINVIFLMAAVILIERFFRDGAFLEPLLRERAKTPDGEDEPIGRSNSDDGTARVNEDESNDIYKHMVIVEAPMELWAPSTSLDDSQAFFYYMRWRARMGVDMKAWKFVIYGWLWGMITEHVGAPPDNPRTVLCAVIFTIAFPFYIPFALIFFAFNTLPLMYCMTRCLQTLISDHVNCTEMMFSLLIAVASIAWFFKFIATFVYIAELIGYSFMGFVVNADVVGPTVLVIVIIAGYIVRAITEFYDGYCVLFSKVIAVAEAHDDAVEKKRAAGGPELVVSRRRGAAARNRMARQTQSSTEQRQSSIEMEPMDEERDNGAATTHPPPGDEAAYTPLVSFNAKSIPTLQLNFFWLIVEKYRPIRVQVASTFLQLLVIILCIGFGMSILAIADSLSNLSTTVELFASVIIAGVVPTVLLALKSPASQDCYDQAKERQIKADVTHFAQTGHLKSSAA